MQSCHSSLSHSLFAAVIALAATACQGTLHGGPGLAGEGEGPSTDDPSTETPPDATDPGSPTERTPAPPVAHGTLSLRVVSVDGSSVTVAWDSAEGAEGYDVSIGPEPPATEDGALPSSLEVASVGADATTFTVDGLAPGVDVFVRVQARGADDAWGLAHGRTDGGLHASVEMALRRVEAYGPRTLALTLLDHDNRYDGGTVAGDHGAAWAGGTWSVERRDGSAVGVAAVHRATEAGGQPDYPVGFEVWGDANVIDLVHRIYLVLDEPLGAHDVLRVRHEGTADTALDVRVPYSDRYLETTLLQVNQVGYNPRATRRWAYVSGWMGEAGTADLSGLGGEAEVLAEPIDPVAPRRTVVDGLSITARAASDAEAGGEVREIDLATVPAAEGVRYRVRIPGVGVSFATAVSEDATMRAFYTVSRGLFHNRWCGDLDAGSTEWSRPADHCTAHFVTGHSYDEFMFPESTPRVDERPVRGGHHDAGDFDIRPFHVLAGQYLLRAFELDPSRFEDGQLTVPESANGIPDLLDEALWSIAAWQDLQNPDGSVRAGVESHRHPAGVYKADADELPYWTWDPEPWHTAYVAALFAQAARLVAPYDAERAAELEADARAADASTVAASSPAAYRMYAASELLALTGESRYADRFEAAWAELDDWGHGAFDHMQSMTLVYPGSFHQGFAMADFVMGYTQSDLADPAVLEVIRRELHGRADGAAAALLDSPHAHRNGRRPDDGPDWGHTSSTGRHADFLYQALQLGGLSDEQRQRYFDAISVAADYALGCNPMGIVYLTGLGSRSPRQPLHLDSLAFLKEGRPPVPGIPVYGPVRGLPGAYYYEPIRASFYPAFDALPPGRRYADSRTAVTTSEFTVWESQAPFAELFAALVAPSMMPPDTWLPGGASHAATLPEHFAE